MFVFLLNGPMGYSSNGTSFSYNACVTKKSRKRKEEIISVNIDLFLGPKLLVMYIIWNASFPGAAEVLVMYLPNILFYTSLVLVQLPCYTNQHSGSIILHFLL